MIKLSNRIITTERSPVFIGNDALKSVDRFIKALQVGSGERMHGTVGNADAHPQNEFFILVDQETRKYCLPLLLENSVTLANARILEIEGGEHSKSLATAEKLWNELLSAGATRNSLLVNLGGGVVSDLGGFTAAGYKRGIKYINIPTSLMGQADASIGGKTAVNIGHVKNQIGFFYSAAAIFIYPGFLKTLPEVQLRSGLAEIIKSALISDAVLWHKLLKHPVGELVRQPVENGLWLKLISGSVKFKNRLVMTDYHERKLRKALNFGHTIGHALEGYSHQESKRPMLHGEAVAAGMICAASLSYRKTGLSLTDLEAIKTYIADGYPSFSLDDTARSAIMQLIMHDKKISKGRIQFTLISKPGSPVLNVSCSHEEIMESLNTLSGWDPVRVSDGT